MTFKPIRPSSINILDPTLISSAKCSYVTEILFLLPIISFVDILIFSPVNNSISGTSKIPVRNSGPFVSIKIAAIFPVSSMACLILLIMTQCS